MYWKSIILLPPSRLSLLARDNKYFQVLVYMCMDLFCIFKQMFVNLYLYVLYIYMYLNIYVFSTVGVLCTLVLLNTIFI